MIIIVNVYNDHNFIDGVVARSLTFLSTELNFLIQISLPVGVAEWKVGVFPQKSQNRVITEAGPDFNLHSNPTLSWIPLPPLGGEPDQMIYVVQKMLKLTYKKSIFISLYKKILQ